MRFDLFSYVLDLNGTDQLLTKFFLHVLLKARFAKSTFLAPENVIQLYYFCFFFYYFLDAICSSSDGRLCLAKSSTGKVKLRIDELFPSKASIGCFVSLDEEDKFFAIGNDDGDVKVPKIL